MTTQVLKKYATAPEKCTVEELGEIIDHYTTVVTKLREDMVGFR